VLLSLFYSLKYIFNAPFTYSGNFWCNSLYFRDSHKVLYLVSGKLWAEDIVEIDHYYIWMMLFGRNSVIYYLELVMELCRLAHIMKSQQRRTLQ